MKKQKILTIIIIIAVIALIGIIGYIIYDEKNNNQVNNKPQNTVISENQNTEKEPEEEPKIEEKEPENQYIGKEEDETLQEEDVQMTKDEKAIQLAKNEWGEDESVTFSIEEKKENIYYVSVKSNAMAIAWYEVNTETWTISEFY